MPITGNETQISTSVPNLVCLEGLPTSAWAPGELAFVQETKSFYYFDPESVLDVNGSSVVATENGCGRWILTCLTCASGMTGATGGIVGPPGPQGEPGTAGTNGTNGAPGAAGPEGVAVANLTALSALNSTTFNDGTIVFVESVKDFYRYEAPLVPVPFETDVVSSTFAPANGYIRLLISAFEWRDQATWFADSAAGNDENPGTALLPIKTIREWWRRTMGRARQATTTLNLVGAAWPGTDPFKFGVAPDDSTAGGGALFIVKGTYTVVRSSAFTAASTNEDPATNTAPQSVDNTVANWTADVGRFIRVTSGATLGSVSAILKDLGAGVVRDTRYVDPDTLVSGVTPLAGDTYSVVTPTTLATTAYTLGSIGLRFQAIQTNASLRENQPSNRITYAGCRLDNVVSDATIGGVFRGCILSNSIVLPEDGRWIFISCGFLIGLIATQSSHVQCIDCVFQTATCAAGTHGAVLAGGFIMAQNCGVFDSPIIGGINTLGAGFQAQFGGTLWLYVAAYGSGNGRGCQTYFGATVMVNISGAPTVTGTVELSVDNTPNQIPTLQPGLVVPAAAPCTTWAQWIAAPFNRAVNSVQQGSKILGAAL